METIGNKLRQAMKDKKVSQTALANALGLSQQQISYNLGRDESEMAIGFVRKACGVMGVDAATILLTPEELAALSEINPIISPIAEELNFAAEHYSRTWQALVFGGIMAMLKKYRQMYESGEWK